MKNRYSWKRDLPDHRDFKLSAPAPGLTLPASVDLRSQMPEVYDQGNLGSCTANAGGGAFQYMLVKEGKTSYVPSRLFIYYNERVIDGTVRFDAGSTIRTCMKALNKYGAAHETLWPYLTRKYTTKPTTSVFVDGAKHTASQYLAVSQTLPALKASLSDGYPVVFGFSVYESFESTTVATTGIVPMPTIYEAFLGGHAVVLVGYNDATQRFTCRNSWGSAWGDNGYFYMPYAYVTNSNLCGDFWTIRYAN